MVSPFDWSCIGLDINDDANFYLKNLPVSKVLYRTPAESINDDTTVTLFKFKYYFKKALKTEQGDLFCMCKQQFFGLQTVCLDKKTVNYRFYISEFFQNCREFLHYIRDYIHYLSFETDRPRDYYLLIDDIVDCLHKVPPFLPDILDALVTLHLVTTKSSLEYIYKLPNLSCESLQYLEILIDARIHLCAALYEIVNIAPDYQGHCIYHIQSLWDDLTKLGLVLFSIHTDQLRIKHSPFPSPSIIEIWLTTTEIVDNVLTKSNSNFYQSLMTFLESFCKRLEKQFITVKDIYLEDIYSNEGFLTETVKVKFTIWMIYNLACVTHVVSTTSQIVWDALNSFLTSSLISSSSQIEVTSVDESTARFLIWNLINLSSIWNTSSEVVLMLWDHFSKRLMEPFMTEDGKIPSIRYCFDFVKQIIANPKQTKTITEPLEKSSFELYLGLIALHFSQDSFVNISCEEIWRPYKGKFYSKLSYRKFLDCSIHEILNIFTLSLLFSYLTDAQDISDKICGLLAKLLSQAPKMSDELLIAVWSALINQLAVFTDKKLDCFVLFDRVIPLLNELIELTSFDQNNIKRNWLVCSLIWDYLRERCSTLEEIRALIYMYTTLYGQYITVFSEHYSKPIILCLTHTLTNLQCTFQLHGNMKPHAGTILYYIFDNCYPLWKNSFILTNSCCVSVEFGKLLALLFSISLECSSRTAEYKQIFSDVLLVSPGTCQIAITFITHVLTDDVSRSYVLSNQDELNRIIKAWLSFIFLAYRYPQYMTDIKLTSNAISTLPMLSDDYSNNVDTEDDILLLIDKLLSCIPSYSSDINYFSDFIKWVEPILSDEHSPIESLDLVYHMSSSLLTHCHALIYSKNSNCLLPNLIDYLYLPTYIHTKHPHPSYYSCIRKHISSFILGLLKLLSLKPDEFILRKVKQIFSKHFHRFIQQSRSNSLMKGIHNPFKDLFEASCNIISNEDYINNRPLLILAMNLIRELFLALPQQPSTLIPTLSFLRDVILKANSNFIANVSSIFIQPLLGCLLACNMCSPSNEPPTIRSLVEEIIKKLFKGLSETPPMEVDKNSLKQSIMSFVENNFKNCHGKVFLTLQAVAIFDKNIIIDALPSLREFLNQCEMCPIKLTPETKEYFTALERLVEK